MDVDGIIGCGCASGFTKMQTPRSFVCLRNIGFPQSLNQLPIHAATTTRKLLFDERQKYHLQLSKGWVLAERASRLRRRLQAKDWNHAIASLSVIGLMAQKEGHYPDLQIRNGVELTIEYTTPYVEGLTENDFICAAKIDVLVQTQLKNSIVGDLPIVK